MPLQDECFFKDSKHTLVQKGRQFVLARGKYTFFFLYIISKAQLDFFFVIFNQQSSDRRPRRKKNTYILIWLERNDYILK